MLLRLVVMICFSFGLFARDVTFIVASDSHYGYDQWSNNEAANKAAIDDMNLIQARGAVITGDLTGSGSYFDWEGYFTLFRSIDGFNQDYEVSGKGRLRMPVYEGYGNHDIHGKDAGSILKGIQKRNQSRAVPIRLSKESLHYSWNWDDVHLVQLNLFPGGDGDARNSLSFLKEDLESLKNQGPIILFFHYDFLSDQKSWFSEKDQEIFYEVIKNYPISAIFVGHTHVLIQYEWKGIPVFNAPSVRENRNFLIVRLEDDRLSVQEQRNGISGSLFNIPLSRHP